MIKIEREREREIAIERIRTKFDIKNK